MQIGFSPFVAQQQEMPGPVGETFRYMLDAVIEKAQHDIYVAMESRIEELLRANSREIERRRVAEMYLGVLIESDFWKATMASVKNGEEYIGPSGADTIEWLSDILVKIGEHFESLKLVNTPKPEMEDVGEI